MERNFEELFSQLNFQRWQTEKKTFLTRLALAKTSASDFSHVFMEKIGYTACFLGKVIHII